MSVRRSASVGPRVVVGSARDRSRSPVVREQAERTVGRGDRTPVRALLPTADGGRSRAATATQPPERLAQRGRQLAGPAVRPGSALIPEAHRLRVAERRRAEAMAELEDRLRAEQAECRAWKETSEAFERDYRAALERLAESAQQVLRVQRDGEEKDRKIRELELCLKGTLRIAVRVRPILEGEAEHPTLNVRGPTNIEANGKNYSFNYVWPAEWSQRQIFEDLKPLVQSSMDGYNVALIAYGQTGSGKTFTMCGGEGGLRGVVPRSLELLFDEKARLGELQWNIELTAYCFEIYRDNFYDLLNERSRVAVRLRSGVMDYSGLTTHRLASAAEGVELFGQAERLRSTAASNISATSSRSHSFFVVKIAEANPALGLERNCALWTVDLAGSERVLESGATGDRLKEAASINRSLLQLRLVLREISSRSAHVSYRSSSLTMALSGALGTRSCKTALIVALRQGPVGSQESARSLEFANLAASTSIGAAIEQVNRTAP